MPLGLNFQANIDLTSFNKAISTMVDGLNAAQKRITDITTQVGPQAEKIFKGFKIDPTGVTSPLNSVLGTLAQVGQALDTINQKSKQIKWSGAFEVDKDVKQASTSLNSLVRTLFETADAMAQVSKRMQSTRLLNKSVIDEGGKSLRDLTKDVKELERVYNQTQRALQKDPGNLGLKDELQVIRGLIRGAEGDVASLQQKIRQTQSVGGILQAEAQDIKKYAASVLESYSGILELGKRGQAAPPPRTAYVEPIRPSALPSLPQQTGQTYVEAFVRTLFTTSDSIQMQINNALRDMAARLKFGVDLSGEGVPAAATKELTDKFIARLRGASRAVNAITDSPEARQVISSMSEGVKPPEELIQKIGGQLTKMAQYLWKQVDQYASEMGEGSVASAGATGKIPIETTRAEILPKIAQTTAEINRLTEQGVHLYGQQIAKLTEYRQSLEATLKFAEEHGGITGVAAAGRTGRELTVGLGGRTTTPVKVGISEATLERQLGLDSQILKDEESITETVIRRESVSAGALSGLQRTAAAVEHLSHLWTGMGAEPGRELVSMMQAARQLEELIGRSTQIGAFSPEIIKVISSLPQAVGKTTGYIGREIPSIISDASEILQGTHLGLAGQPAAAPFKEQFEGLLSLDKQMKGVSFKQIEAQIETVKNVLSEAITNPQTQLPKLYTEIGKLNTLLENTSNISLSVREKASTMFESINIGPILEKFKQLESLWTSPIKGKSVATELNAEMNRFLGSFSEEGAQKPLHDILILWQEVYKVVKMYHAEVEEAMKFNEKVLAGGEKKDISAITRTYGKYFDEAVSSLNVGFEGAKEPLMIMNSLNEAFMKLIYLARDLGNVGVNASGILEGTRHLALLTNQAVTGTLPSEVTSEFNSMRQAIESATVVVEAKHLPALQLVLDTVKKLEATTKEFAGGSLYRAPRGLTPEWLTERLGIRTGAEPFNFPGFSLEQAGTGVGSEVFQHGFLSKGTQVSPMGRYFRKVGEEIEEYWKVIGAQLKPTAAEAAFPGSMEVVDVGLKKIQGSIVKSLEYTIDQLTKHEMPISMFEPTVTEYLPKLIDRLGVAKQAMGAPEGRPDIAALDLTVGNTKRQLEVVQALYRELFAVIKSGKPVTDEVFQSMEARAKALDNTFKRELIVDVDNLMNKLRQYIRFGEAVPEAVQQALKLPARTGGTASGIFELLGGGEPGGKSFLETLDPSAILRLEHGLASAKTETLANPWLQTNEKAMNAALWKIEQAQRLVGTQIFKMPESAWPPGLYEQLSPEFRKTVGTSLTGATKEKASLGDLAEMAKAIQVQSEEMEKAERTIPKKIDEVTPLKLAALKNQRKGMVEEIQKTRQVVNEEAKKVQPSREYKGTFTESEYADQDALNRKKAAEDEAIYESAFGTPEGAGTPGTVKGRNKFQTGPNSMVDVTNQSLSLKNRLAELSEQFEVFGHAVSSSGTPINTFMKGMQGITQTINSIIKEMSSMGGLAPTFDAMIEKFNLTAEPGAQVKTVAAHHAEIEDLRAAIGKNRSEYLKARQDLTADENQGQGATSPAHQVLANAQKEYIRLTDELKRKREELIATMDVLLTKENLMAEIHNREVSTIEQLGWKYQILKVGAETGMGAISGRTAHLAPLEEAEKIARENLISGAREGSTFESVALTPSQVISKFFPQPSEKAEQPFKATKADVINFAEVFQEQAGKIAETYQKLNESLRLGIKFPAFDKGFSERAGALAGEVQSIYKEIEEEPSEKVRRGLEEHANAAHDALQKEVQQFTNPELVSAIGQVYHTINQEAGKLRAVQASIDFTEKLRKSTNDVASMTLELNNLKKIFQDLKKAGAEPWQKIPAYEAGAEVLDRARKIHFEAQRDVSAPRGALDELAASIKSTGAAQKDMVSLWERLTNTIKTARNTMADLFMYQVRWYSSMMVFFAIFNRISNLFTNMITAQFEIERATKNMREYSGEIVHNYELLSKIATGAILQGMERWGYSAKDAAEALYQLGSAGLTSKEALAALNPTLAMALATTGDMRESVKTVAGLYNVLSSTLTPLDKISQSFGMTTAAQATAFATATEQGSRFRNIADVLSTIFRDHQVEMNELIQGYQFAISSADMAGLTFEQLSAILAILNDNMIKGQKAGRGINDVLSHLAKDPYDVMASFKQMAIMLGEQGALKPDQMKKVQAVLSQWDYGKLKDKSVFEIMGELSKLINATGLGVAELGRLFETFGILGGRAMAPLLKHWFEIERETIRLSVSTSGVAEQMAERMADTTEKGLSRMSAYFQSAFYDSFQLAMKFSKEMIGLFASWGESFSSMGKSMSSGIGGGFWGGLIEGATKVTPTILVLAGAFGLLGRLWTPLGTFFPAIAAHVVNFGRAVVTTTMGILGFTAASSAAAATAGTTAAAIAAEDAAFIALGEAEMAAATGAAAAGTAFTLSNPVGWIVGITTVILAIGSATGIFKKFFETVDDLIAKSEKSWGEYGEVTAKAAERQKEAWSQATYAVQTRRVLDDTIAGMKDEDRATENLIQKYRLWAVAVGATGEQERRNLTTVQDVKRAIQDLSGAQDEAIKHAELSNAAIADAAGIEQKYTKAVEESASALGKVKEQLEEIIKLRKEGRYISGTESAPGIDLGAGLQSLYKVPLSPAEDAAAKKKQDLLEYQKTGQTDTILKGMREELVRRMFEQAAFSPEQISEWRKEAEGSEQGAANVKQKIQTAVTKQIGIFGGMDKILITLLPEMGQLKPVDREALKKELEEKFKASFGLAEALPGSFIGTMVGRLSKEKSLELGPPVSKKAAEETRNAELEKAKELVRQTEGQIENLTLRFTNMGRTSQQISADTVNTYIREKHALQEKLALQQISLNNVDLEYQKKRLLGDTPEKATPTQKMQYEAAVQKNISENQLIQNRILRDRNTIQDEYFRTTQEWMKRQIPLVREGLISGAGKGAPPPGPVSEITGTPEQRAAGASATLAAEARQYTKGVSLVGINEGFLQRFKAMSEEYFRLTGKVLEVTSGFRSYEDQLRVRAGAKPGGYPTATPGKSRHGGYPGVLTGGLAIDIPEAQAAYLEAKGLLEKYMIERPVKGDPIHLQPTNIQAIVESAKKSYGGLPDAAKALKPAVDQMFTSFFEFLVPKAGQQPMPTEQVRQLVTEFGTQVGNEIPGAWENLSPQLQKRFQDLSKKVGVAWKDNFKLVFGSLQQQLEAGLPVADLSQIDKFFADFEKGIGQGLERARGIGPKEKRDLGLKMITSYVQQDVNWRPETFARTIEIINRIGDASNVTRTKLYNMITTGLNPELMKEVLRGNEDLTVDFFHKFVSAFDRAGMVPSKLYTLWETAITEMLGIGEVFTQKTLQNWAQILKENPVKKLTDDAAAFSKYFTLLAARQDLVPQQIAQMSTFMREFGSTSGEVWKAIGDVEDQQIRRIRADWYDAASGMKSDLKESATLGTALWDTMIKGVSEFASKLRDPFQMLADTISSIMENTRSTLEEMFTDMGMRAPKTMQEYVNKWAEGMIKIGSKNLSEQVMEGFTDLIGSATGMTREQLAKVGLGKENPQKQLSAGMEKVAASTSSMDNVLKGSIANSGEITAKSTASMDQKMGGTSGVESMGSTRGGEYEGVGTEKYALNPELDPWYAKMKAAGIPIGRTSSAGTAAGTGGGTAEGFTLSNIPIIGPLFSMLQSLFKGIGHMIGFRTGGIVPGFGHGDIVPAMLEPGELIVPRSIVRRFQEGGEAEGGSTLDEEALQNTMESMVDARVSESLKPFQDAMNPESKIGGGYYGPAFEKQVGFQEYLDRAAAADNARKLQENAAITQRNISAFMSQPSAFSMGMSLLKGIASFPGIPGGFALGGLIPRFADGGSILSTQSYADKPWMFGHPGMITIDKTPKTSWFQTLSTWVGGLLGPTLMLNKMLNKPAGGASERIGQEKFALNPQSDPWYSKMVSEGVPIGRSPDMPIPESGGFFSGIGNFFSGIGSTIGGWLGFAKGGLVPAWANRYAMGSAVQAYYPSSGWGSSTYANNIILGSENKSPGSMQGSYWPAMIMALLPLLMILQKYGIKKPSTPTTPEATSTPGAEEPGFFSKMWSGIKGIFGFAEGGSVLDYFSPTPAEAMELKDVMPELNKTWDPHIASGDAQYKKFATEAKGGLQDVVSYFQQNNPGVMSGISRVVGTTPEFAGEGDVRRVSGAGGHFNPFTGVVDIDLPNAYLDQSKVRSSFANALIHETAHGLQKTGGPFADWMPQIDSSKVTAYLKQQGITDSKQLGYLSGPEETIARGVAYYMTKQIHPKYEEPQSWPPEYDPIMKQLAKGMATGKYPQAPEQGMLGKLMWTLFGKPPGFAAGGRIHDTVPGFGDGDTVPAWLTPGEFVVNKGTVGFFGPEFFHGLQSMAKEQKANSIAHVAQAAQQAQKFATGGLIKTGPSATTSTASGSTSGASMAGTSAANPDIKMTMVTVVDDASLDQFLNTKKYGDVLVNKLGSRISRRMSGGRAL